MMKIIGYISYLVGIALIIHGGIIGKTTINTTGSDFMPYSIASVANFPELLIGGFLLISGSIFIACQHNIEINSTKDHINKNSLTRTEPKI